jgi:hypothetical protein
MLSKLLETRQILGNAESGKTWTAEAIAAVASLRPDASTINFGSAPIRNARSQAPIFSIGCSRSGTTLLYQDAAIGPEILPFIAPNCCLPPPNGAPVFVLKRGIGRAHRTNPHLCDSLIVQIMFQRAPNWREARARRDPCQSTLQTRPRGASLSAISCPVNVKGICAFARRR